MWSGGARSSLASPPPSSTCRSSSARCRGPQRCPPKRTACAKRRRARQIGFSAEQDVAKFKAIVIEKADKGQTVSLTEFDEADLMDGDVTVRIGWSTINYKDGLAITGKAPVVRRFPMIPGIDFAGEVESSSHPDWKPGDAVILNGWGLGETHLGAYAEKARVKGQWLVRLPASMSQIGRASCRERV